MLNNVESEPMHETVVWCRCWEGESIDYYVVMSMIASSLHWTESSKIDFES